ncbi:hypothetical protein HPB50_024765 [Hyalomma asiaticum]|uniref:Uncharacterized protein n=1 Tax=Hyalomma asiaticum TaxID=266040 RepID=A0ACB7SZ02_HYAAI|nr:hypothetical protein HPB50_024765 [Hyalomma asiaticum]
MSEQTMQMAQGGALGVDSLMWLDMVPMFTGDATGIDIEVFFKILEEAGRLGGWQDSHLICITRCKMTGSAHAFAWQDVGVACATEYQDFKNLALRRFDTEPASAKLQRFISARQNPGEEVRSFADRVRILGIATLETVCGEDPVKTQLRREILAEQLLSRFVAGLSDPVRRFVLSHNPQTFDEAVEVAAREEQIERSTKLRAPSACHVSVEEQIERSTQFRVELAHHASEKRELENRLDRLEEMIERSLGLCGHEREVEEERRSVQPPPKCYDCGELGHTARECERSLPDPRNESPECESTDSRIVEEISEADYVGERGEEQVVVTVVDVCGEDVAQEPDGEEVEVSEMQWQVEMLADEYGESGDEASLSCETPQMPTPREKDSEREEVCEKPREVMSESVAEIAPCEDEVVLGRPEEAREEIIPGLRESGDPMVSVKETSIKMCTQGRHNEVPDGLAEFQ